MTAPTLGLALIAKNEESTLPHLLASTDGAFDQIALLDTGSTDRTVEVFEKWAKTQSNTNCRVGHFEWRDDFAAARNAADELLDTDWLCTADCDDEIIGAGWLKRGLPHLPCDVKVLYFPYLWREGEVDHRLRLRHQSAGVRWWGRLHEGCPTLRVLPIKQARVIPGPADGPHWIHRRGASHDRRNPENQEKRNWQILRRWVADEPENLAPLGMLAAQAFLMGRWGEGVQHISRYVDLRSFPIDGHQEEAERALAELQSRSNAGEEWFGPRVTKILGRTGWMSSLQAESDLDDVAQTIREDLAIAEASR
jgi:glycosyltransferase involved in cell wall biosynthesis